MSSFKGSSKLLLYEGDTRINKAFLISVASAANLADGFLPYNSTIDSVEVSTFVDGTNLTTVMIDGTATLSVTTVTVSLNHPGAEWSGNKATLKFKISYTDGSTSSIAYAYFDRCFLEEGS